MRPIEVIIIGLGFLIACVFTDASTAAERRYVVRDDSGTYRAEIDLESVAPLGGIEVPAGTIAYAAVASIVRIKDGARFPAVYVVLDQHCRKGEGRLVWLTSEGEVAGIGAWERGADYWPTRVAKAVCGRIPGA